MPKKKTRKIGSLRRVEHKAEALFRAAESVLAEGASMAAGFDDPRDFKNSLIQALEKSEHFTRAVQDLHGAPGRKTPSKPKISGASWKATSRKQAPKPSGRVQASRLQPRGNER